MVKANYILVPASESVCISYRSGRLSLTYNSTESWHKSMQNLISIGDIATLARTRFKDSQIAAFSEDCKSHSKRSISEVSFATSL